MSFQRGKSGAKLFNLCILCCYLQAKLAALSGQHANDIGCRLKGIRESSLSALKEAANPGSEDGNRSYDGSYIHWPPLGDNVRHGLELEGDITTPARSPRSWGCHLNELHFLDQDLRSNVLIEILQQDDIAPLGNLLHSL